MGSAANIRNRQIEWGEKQGIPYDKDKRCLRLEDNLCLQKIHPKTRCEFEHGDGGELKKRRGKMPNMHSLFSSAALTCSLFDYWRDKDAGPLAGVLGVAKVHDLCFEQKFPTGLPGNSPNLDVVFHASGDLLFAIESKFTEPYSGDIAKKNRLADSYVLHKSGQKKELWRDKGLPGCQEVAQQLRKGDLCYHHLDAAQLLKHMLVLADPKHKQSKRYKRWEILCLWFDSAEKAAEHHKQEIDTFTNAVGGHNGVVGGGGKIRATTYQELFERLPESLPEKLGDSHKEYEAYRNYLAKRYFWDK